MLPKDEKWALQANTVTTLWGISIRNKDGSYRTPTREELDLLLEIYEAARVNIRDAWHAGFHSSGEGFNGEYPFAHPGRPDDEEKEILEKNFQEWLESTKHTGVSTREMVLVDALREVLGMLRGYISLADDASVPGSDVCHVDAARVRELAELLSPKG